MITINGKQYKELRCSNCQKFMIYQNVSAGIMCIQCPRCGYMNEWIFKYLKNEENTDIVKKYEIEPLKGGE